MTGHPSELFPDAPPHSSLVVREREPLRGRRVALLIEATLLMLEVTQDNT
jgi:hypothetical protein